MRSQGLGSQYPLGNGAPLGGGGGAGQYAFELYMLDGFVRVRAGTVNLIEVTGTDTDIDPADGIKIWIEVTTDTDGIATAAEIGSGTDYPVDTATAGHQPLGAVTIDDDGFIVLPPYIVRGGLRHQMCGEEVHLFGGLG